MSKQKPKAKKSKLNQRVLRGCLIFSVCLSLGVGILGIVIYFEDMMDSYREYLRSILTFAQTEIDGNDMQQCIETMETTETYAHTQEMLNKIKETHDIEYIYIMKPLAAKGDNNMLYVMTGVTVAELEEDPNQTMLGDLSADQFDDRVSKYYMDRMDGSTGITYYANYTAFGTMYTGMVPIMNSKDETVAILSVDINIQEMVITMVRYIAVLLVGCVIFSAVFLVLLYHWMKCRVVRPVEQMEESARMFVDDTHKNMKPENLQFQRPDIQTGDEIQSLSDTLCKMADDVKTYMADMMAKTKEKERISSELHWAKQIQADMLPSIFPPFPEKTEFDIFAIMNPAKEVGGDFYDFFLLDDRHLAMVIADVSGKGVPAAMFMVIAKTLIKNRAQQGGTPSEILADVNNQLCEGNKAQMFVTVWFAIIDYTTGKGLAANAGHEHPVIRRKNGDFELVKYRHSMALAAMEGIPFKHHEFELQPGDLLFVYTDGVPEATNADNELYGTDRMLAALNRCKDKPLEDLLKGLRSDIREFVGSAPQFDDITMMGLTFAGKGDEQP